MARLLVVMGSGETSPTMSKVHRALFDRLGGGAAGALLDTPYAFQENREEISRRAQEYFRTSVGRTVRVARFRSDAAPLESERALNRVRRAPYVFSGPGSPTYALRHWKGSAVPDLLAEKLEGGGVVVFASAAALTLGAYTVPVYEIYKAGEDPHWVEGLDLLSLAGLQAAVIPHFDNAEGGTHDTRYCYLGERRLRLMEEELPEEAFILGVDEHTACILDLEEEVLEVVGRGAVTVRRRGRVTGIEPGTTTPLAELRRPSRSGRPAPEPRAPGTGRAPFSQSVERLAGHIEASWADGDAAGVVEALLALEELLDGWWADPTQSEASGRARALLRSMLVRLGEAAGRGLRDSREVLGPFVEVVLEARRTAREKGRWGEADRLRDRLGSLGVEVRDTPEGTRWRLAPPGGE